MEKNKENMERLIFGLALKIGLIVNNVIMSPLYRKLKSKNLSSRGNNLDLNEP